MKFPLSLDLRKSTLDLKEDYLRVIDADGVRLMTINADLDDGTFNEAGLVVDILNAVNDRGPDRVRDLSVGVYKKLLDASCKGDADRMLAKDLEKDPNDGGKKLRSRAGAYDAAVRATLEVLSERGGS